MLIPVLVLGVIGCWDNEVGTEVDQFVQGTWTPATTESDGTFVPEVSGMFSIIFTPNQMVLQMRNPGALLDVSTPYIAEFKYGDQIDANDRWTKAPFEIVNRVALAALSFEASGDEEYTGDFFEKVYKLKALDDYFKIIFAQSIDSVALATAEVALLNAFDAIVKAQFSKDFYDAYVNAVDKAILDTTNPFDIDDLIEDVMEALFGLELDITAGLTNRDAFLVSDTFLQRFIEAEVKLFGFNDSEEIATLSILYADSGPGSDSVLYVVDREITTTDKFYQNPNVFPPFGKYSKN
jgi:hypothetical protein